MSLRQSQELNIQQTNSLMKSLNKKTLLIHKFNAKDNKLSPLLNEINSHFDSVEKYLDISGSIIVGKRLQVNDIVQPQRRVSIKKSPRKQRRNSENIGNTSSVLGTIIKNNQNSEDNSDITPANYEIIDNKKLKSIFDSYKDNAFKQPEIISPKLPLNIENSLLMQKKYMQIQTQENQRSKSMSKYLSRQLNKPESALLINRIEGFRMKREMLNSIDSQIPIEQKYGQYKWNISLRRPDNFQGNRDAYINIRTESNPFWAKVNERYPMNIQMSIKPTNTINLDDYLSFKKNPYLRARSPDKVKSVESMNNLFIKGQDLYKLEYDNAFISPNNKRLHRVFYQNGKRIVDRDINNFYGNEMLYEHYTDNAPQIKKVI